MSTCVNKSTQYIHQPCLMLTVVINGRSTDPRADAIHRAQRMTSHQRTQYKMHGGLCCDTAHRRDTREAHGLPKNDVISNVLLELFSVATLIWF